MDVISAYHQLGSYRAAADECGTTHRTVKKIVDKFEADQAGVPPPPRAERAHNYDSVADLVAERVDKSHGRISAKRLLRRPEPPGTRVLTATSAASLPKRKHCGAAPIIADVVPRCGNRVSTS
ncbi:hypothetical protein MSEDJ_53770 [Mycolicibacterium sediminis]|uniref:Uncharacterized protein n=1 Tax=Mycolicibacterium sediminis TaxID=1286180 RepID=A0A7I7QY81_9MYCO|nr:hypothetical protein MSEDJ_53770 [Mycolicibacterium sediminis]